jgi:anaerobic selenocysteine-containing dehydrogenase
VLTGDDEALQGGGPVTALLIQNTNPIAVAPEQEKVKRGFARDDLFVCVHEQFMTDTAKVADVVLPATMFLEHDDFYTAGGSQYILLGPKLIEPPGECRSNHDVICALAKKLGAEHPGFTMTPRQLIDATLQKSGWGTLADIEANRWIDCQPDFDTAHYIDGFAYPDGKFRFKPDWSNVPFGRWHRNVPRPAPIPALPDHWEVIEEADAEHPFRLATSPARGFLNSTFTETPTSLSRERRPEVMIHPEDAAPLGIGDGDRVTLGNKRGAVTLHAKLFDGVCRGVLIAESLWPNSAYADGRGINTLTGADAIAPFGGAAFHDNRVWVRKAL